MCAKRTEFIKAQKTLDDCFRDFHDSVFPYGYGDGEYAILPLIKSFFYCCKVEMTKGETVPNVSYSYRDLEAKMTKAEAWFLINAFCKENLIDYGSSPRFAWLTESGVALWKYVMSRSFEQLYQIVATTPSDLAGFSWECLHEKSNAPWRCMCQCQMNSQMQVNFAEKPCRNPFFVGNAYEIKSDIFSDPRWELPFDAETYKEKDR